MVVPTSSPRRSRLRRLLATAVAATSLAAVAPLVPLGTGAGSTVSASSGSTPRSASPQVAQTAVIALDALERFEATGEPARFVDFVAARDRAARAAAAELGIDADELSAAWRRTDPTKQFALLSALTQLGVPYRSHASIEGVGFDCSGLTTFAYGRAAVELARNSRAQINQTAAVDAEDAQAGDLVFYPGHIMIYLGVDNAVVHSRNTGSTVEMTFASERRSLRFGDPLDA